MSNEIKRNTVVILPFAHLSKKLATDSESKRALDIIENTLKQNTRLKILRDHFGSHKEVLLHIYEHAGNVRYREFY